MKQAAMCVVVAMAVSILGGCVVRARPAAVVRPAVVVRPAPVVVVR